jgi:hypothetical protein
LPATDILGQFRDPALVESAENMKVVDVIGFKRGVRFELAEPIAVGVLLIE